MPKVGVAPLRKQQLIDATLQSIELHGIQSTTIVTVSRIAGVSSGIISHYFGGKQELLLATIRYLIRSLKTELLHHLRRVNPHDPAERLEAIVAANFSALHVSAQGSKAWLAFWAQSPHNPEFSRLQRANERRLHSNLKYALRALVPPCHLDNASEEMAALIDGLWLRRTLSQSPISIETAQQICRQHLNALINSQGSP